VLSAPPRLYFCSHVEIEKTENKAIDIQQKKKSKNKLA
jgi:hypothetical protein